MDFRCEEDDQIHSQQTDRKHAYITVRQDSIMENQINSERGSSSSPYIRYEGPHYDSVHGIQTTDLNPHSNTNVHGFNVRKHGANISHSQPDSLRDLRRPTNSRDVIFDDANSTYSTSVDKYFINKCTLIILALMFLVTMAFSIYSMIRFGDLESKYHDLQKQISNNHFSLAQTREEPSVCVPCASLQLGPLPEENLDLNKLIQKQENEVTTCCAKTSAQMYIMLNLFVKRKHQETCSNEKIKEEEEKAAANCNNTGSTDILPPSRSGNISAFLVLNTKQSTPNANQNEPQPLRNWNYTLPGAHLNNIYMTQDNSKLVVPEGGRYYIYSQVTFLIHYDIDSNNQQDVTQLLYQTVLRYNAIYPLDGSQVLLKGVTTQCWEKQKKYGKYTTYAGASVQLNKGDQIYISASAVGHVYVHDTMTYFGLFKIG